MYMDMLCIWVCYAYGCVMYMDVLCIWVRYVNGCVGIWMCYGYVCYVYGCVETGRREERRGEEVWRAIQKKTPHEVE